MPKKKIRKKAAVAGRASAKKGAGRSSAKKSSKKSSKKRAKKATGRRGAPARGAAPTELELLVVPVRNMILFPGVVLPLMIGRELSLRAIQAAVEKGEPIGLLLQRDEQIEEPGSEDLFRVGTLAEVVRLWTGPDGQRQAICQGNARFEVLEFIDQGPLLKARVRVVPEQEGHGKEIEARFVALRQQAHEVLQMAPGTPEDLDQAVQAVESPSMLADMAATFMDVSVREKQQLLETFDLKERLDKTGHMLGELAEVLKLSQKIRVETKTSLDRAQREYYLREQLRAIRRELGDAEDADEELAELRLRCKELKLESEAAGEVDKVLRRLETMPEQSAEYPMLRGWLDVVLDLPWTTATEDQLDLKRARRILDEDHHGLEAVKKRILEFLAVRKLNPEGQGPTLCLVGPPGVGKTSLGRSVARALGRKFHRLSLGGVHDEAEIRGHRRTYVGAMPGNVLTGLRRAGSRNPVFLLDEMDKLTGGYHGDPSAALLEVLDPAQNRSFRDNYLGMPFDLRPVLFLGTANVLESIPGPLRDRLEVIHIPGYTAEEKLAIARRFLVKRQLAAAGLNTRHCRIEVATLREILRSYTREAGVRELERTIGAICRHVAVAVAGGKKRGRSVGPGDLAKILGPPRYESEVALRTATPGVVTGLAWTPVGGELLFLETARIPGKGEVILTGQLGDVMRESARAALSIVRGKAERWHIPAEAFEDCDLHVHVPAGAIPKDGPSAGVGMVVALVSLLTGRCAHPDLAMTGEVSLRGLVLPVGGVKEKVLAALAAGVRTILLPERNRRDLDEIPAAARKQLRFVYLKNVEQAVSRALEPR